MGVYLGGAGPEFCVTVAPRSGNYGELLALIAGRSSSTPAGSSAEERRWLEGEEKEKKNKRRRTESNQLPLPLPPTSVIPSSSFLL